MICINVINNMIECSRRFFFFFWKTDAICVARSVSSNKYSVCIKKLKDIFNLNIFGIYIFIEVVVIKLLFFFDYYNNILKCKLSFRLIILRYLMVSNIYVKVKRRGWYTYYCFDIFKWTQVVARKTLSSAYDLSCRKGCPARTG